MEMTVYEFFDKVLAGELGLTDIYNYIQKSTENFDVDQLKRLQKDIDYCLFCAREEIEGNFSPDDIESAINEFKANNKEIPYITIPAIKKGGEKITEERKILNLEKLLFPYDFFLVYQINFLLEDLIKQNNKNNNMKLYGVFDSLKTDAENIKNISGRILFYKSKRKEFLSKFTQEQFWNPDNEQLLNKIDFEIECLTEIEKTEKKLSKQPKINDFNKPVLSQKQIAILFQIFKNKRIINNRDIDKTNFAEIISNLTGYSKNTIRQDLSENELISDKQTDYEKIIFVLKEVIKEIENTKNNIAE